jgi:hypothetical protein
MVPRKTSPSIDMFHHEEQVQTRNVPRAAPVQTKKSTRPAQWKK